MAQGAIWLPVSSATIERSFSVYKRVIQPPPLLHRAKYPDVGHARPQWRYRPSLVTLNALWSPPSCALRIRIYRARYGGMAECMAESMAESVILECQLRRTYLPILWAEHNKKSRSLLEGRHGSRRNDRQQSLAGFFSSKVQPGEGEYTMQVMNVIVTLEEKAFLADVVPVHHSSAEGSERRIQSSPVGSNGLSVLQKEGMERNFGAFVGKGCACTLAEEMAENVSEDMTRFIMTRFIFMWPGLFTKQPGRRKRYNDYMGQYLPKVSTGNVTHGIH